MLILMAAVAVTALVPDERMAKLAALYERVCLQTFPDDKAVEALMQAEQAQEMPAADVKITMGDDPARAWLLADGSTTVWIEYPPFHACSVRFNAPGIGDMQAYRAVADRHEQKIGGFSPIAPYDADQGPVHVHAEGEDRTLADDSKESLFVFTQHITDPARRKAGETAINMRFVHQFAPPAK